MARRSITPGQRVGRWTILEFSHKGTDGALHWRAVCDCGTQRVVRGGSVLSGRANSCGCLIREAHTTHGMSKTPTFKSWESMRARCENPNDPSYARYGGRGIKVCRRWWESFEAFLEDMGERPEGHTLDRIDNDGDYAPENCRWATHLEQQRNTRSSRRITVNGETLPVIEWAKRAGLPYQLVLNRLIAGWPDDQVLRPPRPKRRSSTNIAN